MTKNFQSRVALLDCLVVKGLNYQFGIMKYKLFVGYQFVGCQFVGYQFVDFGYNLSVINL